MARPLFTRLCATAAAIALVTLSAPMSATAVEEGDNGENLGSITLAPASGGWDDPAILTGDFACPQLDGAIDTYIYAYVTDVGAESPIVGTSTSPLSGSIYAFTNSSPIQAAPDGDAAVLVETETAFPVDYGSWFADADGDLPTLREALEVGGEYSLVLACAYYLEGDSGSDPRFIADATGHISAAWTGLNVTANGWTTGSGSGGGGGGETTTAELALTASATTTTTVTLAAAVTAAGGAAATDAAGSVEFFRGTESLGTAVVATGGASLDVTGLTPNSPYSFTAAFTPTSGSAYSSATAAAFSVTTLAAGTDPVDTVLATGGTVTPGRNYRVEAPAGTFTAGDTLAGVIQSDPITLAETATAGSDGSASYAFIAPTALPAGQHTLTLAGTPSASTYVISFTVAAQVAVVTPGVTPAAGNRPFAALTDWVMATSSTPTGVTGIFAGILVLAAAALIGWRMIFTRRPTVTGRKYQP